MTEAGLTRVTGTKDRMLHALTQALSWPTLFSFFRWLQKFSLHAMNRTTAGFLPVTLTGERHVVRRIVRNVPRGRPAVILDCGGNVGVYTEMVLAECRRARTDVIVHVFEPSSHCQAPLAARFRSQSSAVRVHQVALSNRNGRAPIFFAWPGAGGTSLSSETSWIQGTSALGQQSEDVAIESLDSLCEREGIGAIDLIKLDIEGAELAALDGAAKLIDRGAIGAIQFELGSAALPVGASLYQFWARYAGRFQFYLVLVHGLKRLDDYAPDLECFYSASTFLMIRRPQPA